MTVLLRRLVLVIRQIMHSLAPSAGLYWCGRPRIRSCFRRSGCQMCLSCFSSPYKRNHEWLVAESGTDDDGTCEVTSRQCNANLRVRSWGVGRGINISTTAASSNTAQSNERSILLFLLRGCVFDVSQEAGYASWGKGGCAK